MRMTYTSGNGFPERGAVTHACRMPVLVAVMLAFVLALVPATALAATDSSSSAAASGAQTGTYVFDERGLFTSDQFQTLEATAADLASKYNMGVYFLTTDYMDGLQDPTSSQRTSYATTYYKDHKLGLNPAEGVSYGDGIMFVIAADSRDYVTIAYGKGSYAFSDKGISSMEDAVLDNIKDHRDNWYGAATTYYNQVGSQLQYYEAHGKPQEPIGLSGYVLRIFIFIGIPLIITFFVIRRWRREMKTAVEQSEAGKYLDENSVNVTKSNDTFVNTTLAVVPKPKKSDSDSGGWGGGGGGGFSSSGGGKF